MTDHSKILPATIEAFRETLSKNRPSGKWPLALQCLWFDAKGDWTAAHDIAQDLAGPMGSRLHAYLHRKEGDRWNAEYWYRRAGKSFPQVTLEDEFDELIGSVLE